MLANGGAIGSNGAGKSTPFAHNLWFLQARQGSIT